MRKETPMKRLLPDLRGSRIAAGIPAPLIACAAVLTLAATLTTAGADCTGVAPAGNTGLKTVAVATGLTGRPLFVASPPGDGNRLFILEQNGLIRIKKRGDPPGQITTFLDISARVQASTTHNEMGLLGLAFDPDYASTGLFYVNYTEGPVLGPWFTVVARYSVSGTSPDVADPNSEARLLRFAQPQDNHNGGQLQFGPDGFLYVSTGDGGGSGDVHGTCGNGQDRTTLLGKMLRLDVRGVAPLSLPPDCGGSGANYRIPADNPFADGLGGSCDEIWTYGLRNPWRSAFDAATGDLYIADVGQNCWEEVDYLPAGAGGAGGGGQNLGWRQMEATHCFNVSQQSNCDPPAVSCSGVPPCHDPSLVLPVLEYGHNLGCSITGGYVYRGCLMPNFAGTYFYGDFCAGFVRTFRIAGGVVTNPADRTLELDPGHTLSNSLTSFGVDDQGEIYINDRDGTILRILPPFRDLEVAGTGTARPLTLDPAGWTWEDLQFATMHPVAFYRVYRGVPRGDFTCIFTTPEPRWIGGDPGVPAPGAVFAYVVTAVSPDGQETRSGDPPQSLLPGTCP